MNLSHDLFIFLNHFAQNFLINLYLQNQNKRKKKEKRQKQPKKHSIHPAKKKIITTICPLQSMIIFFCQGTLSDDLHF
jgi:hypothetical protein